MAPRRSTTHRTTSSAATGRRTTFVSLGIVGLATGAAFAAGSHLRERFSDHLTGRSGLSARTRLAQIEVAGGGALGAGGGAHFVVGAPPRGASGGAAGADEDDEKFMDAVSLFQEVYAQVKDNYVDKLPGQTKMAQGAVKGMVAELNDPHCRFLEPAERTAFENEAKGTYAGIGAALRVVGSKRDGYTEHRITVVAPLAGSPAEKAGLRNGDVITSVDKKYVLTAADPLGDVSRVLKRIELGEATEDEVEKAQKDYESAVKRISTGTTLGQAMKKLIQGTNEKRTLIVQRPGVKAPLTIEMTTATTSVPAPSVKTLAGGATYLRVAALTSGTAGALREALANAAPGRGGLVLDLRNNPGGPLSAAQAAAGVLLKQASRNGVANTAHLLTLVGPRNKRVALSAAGGGGPALRTAAASSGRSSTRPIVVLVNKGTAGEAEALAVALRDKGVATLMGGQTFGDALVQTLFPLADGSGFLLTTGKLLGATGTDWQKAGGLSPTVSVAANTPEDQVLSKAAAYLGGGGARPGVAAAAAATR